MPEQVTQKDYWSGKVGDEWAARARGIDAMLAPMTGATLERAGFAPGEVVLDVGCGSGATSLEIARRVAPNGRVVGVDLSPQLLAVARERAQNVGAAAEFLEADAGAADFGVRFDAAFSRFGVMFFDEPERAFAHIRAQLKPGGRMAFVCWRTFAENGWATAAVETIAPMLSAPLPAPDPDAPGPFAFADRAKLERVLSASGWRDIDIRSWDGDMLIGGGGSPAESAEFLLRIGPCARAVAEQGLAMAAARQRLVDTLGSRHGKDGLALAGACWVVTARV
jgi:SAM-dependent methyltransferase